MKRPPMLWLLMLLLLFQGISAMPSGLLLALDPSGGLMQMPLDMLESTPFPNYRVPGLILGIVLGLGAFCVLACLYFLPDWTWTQRVNPFKRQHWTWTVSAAFGLALMIWISVQVLMITLGSWLQAVYFGLGLAILLLTLSSSVKRYLSWPANNEGEE